MALRYRKHLWHKHRQYPRWLIDFAIEYSDTHRNLDYLQLLLEYGDALLLHRIVHGGCTEETLIDKGC